MIKAKQIDLVISALVRVGNFSASGVSDDATAALSAILAIAGRGGVSVPVQTSTGENVIGIVVGAASLVQIQRTSTGEKIADSRANEVYGRLTEAAGGGYLLSYYVSVAGVETAYDFTTVTAIDLDLGYRFDFARLPADFAIAVPTKILNNDPRVAIVRDVMEALPVTALNTLTPLTFKPTGYLALVVNELFYALSLGFFTVNADTRVLTWSATIAKFNLDPTDKVVAFYGTLE